MSDVDQRQFEEREALLYHSEGRPGKLEVIASKPMATQRDLSLAYSPGVAAPVKAIAADPAAAYDYTAKGNLVAVISNGTAILGLGNLGALASKPVMEGKAVLFKRFADIDSIDIELATEEIDQFVAAVGLMEPSFGGINLEDIKAPECFVIEQALRERMNIPVFHDDQHGTAIISAAGLINAAFLTGRNLSDLKIVVNGAGAASISCTELVKALGVRSDNVTLCDSKGVIYQGRTEGMNQWKSAHAVDTDARTLAEALHGADVFLGLSVAGALTQDMVKTMAAQPIIFAMANPDPEITPHAARAVAPDAIVATGRSDYANQVNNVLGFPFIFRGALDVRATTINEPMKIAAAQALAELARSKVPKEVADAYGVSHQFGPDYIIPAPFDPRLIEVVPAAVAVAAMASGVARKPIADMTAYRRQLRERMNRTVTVLSSVYDTARETPKRVIFAGAEDVSVLRAAVAFCEGGYGTPVLVGRSNVVVEHLRSLGIVDTTGLEIHDRENSPLMGEMREYQHARAQTRAWLQDDNGASVAQDSNIFAALLLALGKGDGIVFGPTTDTDSILGQIRDVLDSAGDKEPFGVHMIIHGTRTTFLADTLVSAKPDAERLATIAEQAATFARQMGHEPRAAFLSQSMTGSMADRQLATIRGAVSLLRMRHADFEFEGELTLNAALNPSSSRGKEVTGLTEPANILVIPDLHSAQLAAELYREFNPETVFGPMLIGMQKPVQIATAATTTSELLTLAILAGSTIET
ncbi:MULTISPECIES: NADP-dependent malic enzyme [unclassified Sphingomonas]|uniref:NADP-dependent malic enzyme n=1 Tax=unclassified Sphingomonas TaxID=196159 RepID=UPI00226A49ED|nr:MULTISPECIES: NADP-dependent malic enzyme [unclassified Sphingomonas]